MVRKKNKNTKKEYLGDNVTRFLAHLKEFGPNCIVKLLTIEKIVRVSIDTQKWELIQNFPLITMAFFRIMFLNFEIHRNIIKFQLIQLEIQL